MASHTLSGLLNCPGGSVKRSVKGAAPIDPNASLGDLPVLLLVDTAGCGFEERQEEEGDSRSNEGEAKVGQITFIQKGTLLLVIFLS